MKITLLTPQGIPDYELLDSGNQERLERFGPYIIARPDPQLIWRPHLPEKEWQKADAYFVRTSENGGHWQTKKPLPEKWPIRYGDVSFYLKLTPFKHTGFFPEQTAHWQWMSEKIKKASRPIKVLNLFAYTGIASLVCAAAGAHVTHVDASRPTIGWARQNQEVSGLQDKPIRWILDDVMTFIGREIRRQSYYDAIIMDPPVYGRGPKGETWSFNTSFPSLMAQCQKLLSKHPLFILTNAYAISSSALTLGNVLKDHLPKGQVEQGELCLKEKSAGRFLSTGIFARWCSYTNLYLK